MRTGSKSPLILLVDGEPGSAFSIENSFRGEPWRLAIANSGAAALNWLRENTPDLILLDLKVGDLGPSGLVARVSNSDGGTPFIIIAGRADEKAAAGLVKRGAMDWMARDAHFLKVLPEVVRRALQQIEHRRRIGAAEAERKRLECEIIEIAEREQMRIGQDIHDGLGQQLTAIEFLCESLKDDLRRMAPELVPRVERAGQFLRSALADTRLISHGLAPMKLSSDGLMDSLQKLSTLVSNTGRLKCGLDCPRPVLVADAAAARHLFRIAQEATNNALKHAHAQSLLIRLNESPRAILLRISDDGCGFNASNGSGNGIGLEVMRHRADIIGAKLRLQSNSHGTTVSCELSKPNEPGRKD